MRLRLSLKRLGRILATPVELVLLSGYSGGKSPGSLYHPVWKLVGSANKTPQKGPQMYYIVNTYGVVVGEMNIEAPPKVGDSVFFRNQIWRIGEMNGRYLFLK